VTKETQEGNEAIDWSDDVAVAKHMLGAEIEGGPPEPEAAEDAGEPAAAATEAAKAEDEQPRDAHGKFMPLDAHKRVLENERTRREQVEAEKAALEAQLAEMQKQMAPKQSDADFEAAIGDLPDDVANVMRAERNARLVIEQQLAGERAQRETAERNARLAEQQRTHERLLDTVPTVRDAYADPIKRAAIDAISDHLIEQAGGKVEDSAAHYKAVEAEYLKRFPVAPKPRELPGRQQATPPSLSSIPGSAPVPAGNPLEEIERLGAMGSAARFNRMTERQLDKYLAGL